MNAMSDVDRKQMGGDRRRLRRKKIKITTRGKIRTRSIYKIGTKGRVDGRKNQSANSPVVGLSVVDLPKFCSLF